MQCLCNTSDKTGANIALAAPQNAPLWCRFQNVYKEYATLLLAMMACMWSRHRHALSPAQIRHNFHNHTCVTRSVKQTCSNSGGGRCAVTPAAVQHLKLSQLHRCARLVHLQASKARQLALLHKHLRVGSIMRNSPLCRNACCACAAPGVAAL